MSPFETLERVGCDGSKVQTLARRVAEIDRRCTTFEITRAERDDLVRDVMDMTQLERDACTLEELRALDAAVALIAKVLKLA